MDNILHVLMVEDSEDDVILISRTLQKAGYELVVRRVQTHDEMYDALVHHPWDLVLSDHSMPGFSGTDALHLLQEQDKDLPFIIVSGQIGEERAVEIMRAGAHDYVMKGSLMRLVPAIQRELREAAARHAHREAQQQVLMLSSALEQSASLVMITDTQGVITYVNPTFCRVTGFTSEEVLEVHSRILKSDATPDEVYEELWTTILAGSTWRGELYNQKKNGEGYWAEVRISSIRDSADKVTHFLSVQEDITERKNLEAELQHYMAQLEEMVEERTAQLRQAKEQMETILENTGEAIALALPNGDIQAVNPAYRSMFDEAAWTAIEGMLWNLPGAEYMEPLAEAILSVINDHKNRRLEIRISTKDGQDKDVDVALFPIPMDVEQFGVLMSARDVTHIKEIERFKERFVANVLHDLTIPISGLNMRIFLLKKAPQNLPEHIRSMENQVDHLLELVSDLRTLAELDRSQIMLNRELLNLNDVVQRVFDTYEPIAIHRQQTLQLELDPSMPESALDRRLFERVISNLVANAINYTPEGKAISVRTGFDGVSIMLEVVDEGIGIGEEDREKIFDRFFRVKSKAITQPKGTGLGLSIVKEVVELHGGSVILESELGKGTTFRVQCPYSTQVDMD